MFTFDNDKDLVQCLNPEDKSKRPSALKKILEFLKDTQMAIDLANLMEANVLSDLLEWYSELKISKGKDLNESNNRLKDYDIRGGFEDIRKQEIVEKFLIFPLSMRKNVYYLIIEVIKLYKNSYGTRNSFFPIDLIIKYLDSKLFECPTNQVVDHVNENLSKLFFNRLIIGNESQSYESAWPFLKFTTQQGDYVSPCFNDHLNLVFKLFGLKIGHKVRIFGLFDALSKIKMKREELVNILDFLIENDPSQRDLNKILLFIAQYQKSFHVVAKNLTEEYLVNLLNSKEMALDEIFKQLWYFMVLSESDQRHVMSFLPEAIRSEHFDLLNSVFLKNELSIIDVKEKRNVMLKIFEEEK